MTLNTYRVAAYITAYEDAEALNACLVSISGQSYQLEDVLVVDNSYHPLLLEPEAIQNLRVQVLHHPNNIGIAAGMNLAIAWAQSQNYDFLWLFDQDSTPETTCLENLINTYSLVSTATYPIGILGPMVVDYRTGGTIPPALFLKDHFHGYTPPSNTTTPFECDAPITSGSLVYLHASQQISPPDSRLFIDGIDMDYGLRLRKAGFYNLIVPSAIMYHRFGAPLVIETRTKKKVIQLYSPLRHYYICRNHTYLSLFHSEGWNRFTCTVKRIDYTLKTIRDILAFDPQQKSQKVFACLVGTYRGFKGDMDKYWQ